MHIKDRNGEGTRISSSPASDKIVTTQAGGRNDNKHYEYKGSPKDQRSFAEKLEMKSQRIIPPHGKAGNK